METIIQKGMSCKYISRIRMFCHGIEEPNVLCHDILKVGKEETLPGKPGAGYDLVIADLPKGNNRSAFTDNHERMYREWMSIQSVLDRVGDKGKAIILVTKGALVRQMEKEIRESLTEADWLEEVITMPVNMYASTHLGFELLVFNKWKPPEYRGKVFMADTSNMKYGGSVCNEISRETVRELQRAYADFKEHGLFSAVVSLEEIRKKEFSWNPFLYLRFRKEEENRKIFNNTNLSRLPVPDYKNPEELQRQFKQIYQEYRMSVKEAKCRFETERKKLLRNLQ